LEKACQLPAAVLLLLLVLRSIAAVTLWKFPFFKMAKFEFESKLSDLDYFTVKRANLNGELHYDTYNSIFKSSIQVDNVNILNIQIFKESMNMRDQRSQNMNENASLHLIIKNANPDEAIVMEISFELGIQSKVCMVKKDIRAPFGSLEFFSKPFDCPNLPAEVQLRIAIKVLNDSSDMKAKLNQMFLDTESADVSIVCRDGQLKAHKFVLALRSTVFKANFKFPGDINQIDSINFDHATMTTLLKYMYTDFILQEDITMLLLFAADYYDVQPLVTLSEKTILRTLSLENAMDIFVTSRSKSRILKKINDGAREFIMSNPGKVVKSPDWDTIRSTDPQLAASILEECVFQQ
jgi:hypothetical protein